MKSSFVFATFALAAACGSSKDNPTPSPTLGSSSPGSAQAGSGSATPIDAAAVPPGKSGIDSAGMDRTVKPGDDFFKFANGGWFAKTEIPSDHSSYGNFAEVAELTTKRVSDLIQEAAKTAAPGSDARKVGDYYAAYLDTAAIESKGLAPLQPTLDKIAAVKTPADLAKVLGGTLRADVDVLNNTDFETQNIFGLWVAQDLDDPSKYGAFLLQGGLGLPDRDYYLDPSPRMTEIRTKYQAHLAAMMKLANIAEPDAKAKKIFELEKKIAAVHATRTENVDVKKGNNHWAKADFAKKAPGLDWDGYFAAAGLDKQAQFTVWQPKAISGISALVKSQPIETWKDYLAMRAIEQTAQLLPKAFADESFAFYGGVISGTPQLPERWKLAVDATSDALGEAVGKLYVQKYFPPSEKARAEEMVRHLIDAFGKRIDALAWMSPATKEKAKAKLAALKVSVGYPDKWRDYGKLEVVAGDAFGNAQRASLFELQRNLDKLGQPVDRGEWMMTPQLVNAVNLPVMNALNFPAAILQPPFFDPNRPVSMDYGSIGAVIGHEISHSFDDQGAMFDATGKLANWWTKEDLAHFQQAGALLVKQYDAYQPFPDAHVNGKLTLSENIADVAGLSVAYDGYRLSQGGKEAATLDGFTGDQQFFLSFGQAWRVKYREPALRRRLLTDGHAPGEYRADTVRNLDAWYTAFDVKPGEKLYLEPAQRVKVW
ncbi:MAG TPA: M13 family metallopeptidase [Kofleriaceae bacterium]|nr:M13 family metallopeptidase [Kofleriaceae bacterium]